MWRLQKWYTREKEGQTDDGRCFEEAQVLRNPDWEHCNHFQRIKSHSYDSIEPWNCKSMPETVQRGPLQCNATKSWWGWKSSHEPHETGWTGPRRRRTFVHVDLYNDCFTFVAKVQGEAAKARTVGCSAWVGILASQEVVCGSTLYLQSINIRFS